MEPLADLERKIQNLQILRGKILVVESVGEYPTKANTPVADVCRYQNNGTDRGVSPSRFIERAEAASDGWSDELSRAVSEFMDTGMESSLQAAADKVSDGISAMCDRVKTGRLKGSFRGKVIDGRN